jgi:CIC family chloride channel protein
MEQPNNTSETTRMTPRFWGALVLTAAATGLLGALMMLILHTVQHLAFGYHSGSFGSAVARASDARRLLALMVGGAVVGPAWYVLRRVTAGSSDVDDAVWTGTGELGFGRSLGTGTISQIAIGAGGSLGREAAPKLLGAASGSLLGRWAGLDGGQRRLIVACGAGAGMGAVYNVPLGGAMITAELLIGQLALPVLLPALVCSVLATVVSWVYLPTTVTYPGLPALSLHGSQVGYALLAGPLIGLFATALVRLIGWVSHHQFRGRLLLVGPLLAFTVLGLFALPFPLLLGNGKDLTHEAFLGIAPNGLLVLLALALLKPLVTILCLGSGASGGLFTPVLATGAALGLLLGQVWEQLWPGGPVAAYAVVTAAALVGAAMQAPLTGLVLVLELTGSTEPLIVPMVLATTLATLVVRHIDGYSIYSARLPRRDVTTEPVDAIHA